MNHQELIERMRAFNDWRRGGDFEMPHPMQIGTDIDAMCDAIEYLLAENERLNAELAKYCDAPIVGWQWLDTGTYRKNIKNAAMYRDWNPLIVKPDENK